MFQNFEHFSLSVFKENVCYQGWNSQSDSQNSKQGSSLIWVCTVCLGLLGWQVVFEILECLRYYLLDKVCQI